MVGDACGLMFLYCSRITKFDLICLFLVSSLSSMIRPDDRGVLWRNNSEYWPVLYTWTAGKPSDTGTWSFKLSSDGTSNDCHLVP